MLLSITNIELADQPIISTSFDLFKRIMVVILPSGYDLINRRYLGKVSISINDWLEFENIKYILEPETEQYSTVIAKEKPDIETFMFIQERTFKENILTLNGISDESHCWMTYKFINPVVSIEAEEL